MKKNKDHYSAKNFEISNFEQTLKKRKNIYNEYGFRGDSIKKEGFKIMSIGCSLTEGIGVEENETWSSQLCQKIPNSVNLNFGFGGRSNDYISRCLLAFYDLVKPDLVLIMYTETHRREFFNKDFNVEPFHHKKWGYFEKDENGQREHDALLCLLNKGNNYHNWLKNHLLIKYFLEAKKCNWLWDGWYATDFYRDENRFDGDFYPFLDLGSDNIHPGPITHKTYANKLYDYIKTNHAGIIQ